MRLERLDRLCIRHRAPEANETIRANQNNPTAGQPGLFREEIRPPPVHDGHEAAPSWPEIVERWRAAGKHKVVGRSVEITPAWKARSGRRLASGRLVE